VSEQSEFMGTLKRQLEHVSPEMVDDLYGLWRCLRMADPMVPDHWTHEQRVKHDLKYIMAYVLTRVLESAEEDEDEDEEPVPGRVALVDAEDINGRPIPLEVLDVLGAKLAERLGSAVIIRTPMPATTPAPSKPGTDNAGGVH
jgi:hypothetical protein